MLFRESEGEIKEKTVKYLEGLRESLKDIKPQVLEGIEHWGFPRIRIAYTLDSNLSEVVIKIEPRYFKYLGLEVPQWVTDLLSIKHD